MNPFTFVIDLPVQSHWRNVDLLRTSVHSCFIAVFADVDGCNAIAMITGELLENAIKYGHWAGENKSLRLRVHGSRGTVTIQVENPIDPDNGEASELEECLSWIGQFPNAEAAYKAKLLEIASRPRTSSGLGLVRCAYEGNSTLSSETVDGRALRVTAEMTF